MQCNDTRAAGSIGVVEMLENVLDARLQSIMPSQMLSVVGSKCCPVLALGWFGDFDLIGLNPIKSTQIKN